MIDRPAPRVRRPQRALLASLLAAALTAGCAGEVDAVPVRNVLLITVDTLRADHLGAYGNGEGLTPNLDRLAAGSLIFERAYSQATQTHSALSSLMTGLEPPHHGVVAQSGRLRKNVVPLASSLSQRGVETGAFFANLCKLLEVPERHRHNIFAVGWDEAHCGMFYDEAGELTGEQYLWDEDVVAAASAWISEREGPWFAWVHLMDPHAEHRPAPDLWDHDRHPLPTKGQQYRFYSEFEHALETPPAEVLEELNALYRAEVRGVDRAIGRLLDLVSTRPDMERTAILFSADHGEQLFETFPLLGHGILLTEQVLHVPLMIQAPGVEHGVRSDFVETLQISPTVLQLFDVPAPYALDGPSLLAAVEPSPYAISYCGRIASLRGDGARVWATPRRLPRSVEIHQYQQVAPYTLELPWYRQDLTAAAYGDGPRPRPRWIDVGSGGPQTRRALWYLSLLDRHVADLGELQAPQEIEDAALAAELDDLGYGGGLIDEQDEEN